MKLPPLLYQVFIFWTILCILLILYTDLQLPDLLAQSDYLMTFHCAGYIAAHGLWPSLYPPPEALTFAGAPFDKQAHALLPHMPSWSVAEYMYMPLSAYIFAPFSLLPTGASMLAWQLTSIAALTAGNLLTITRLNRALIATCAAFTFIPLVFTLWIGQVGLVFALLPLAAGYHLIRSGRYLAAGLTLSLVVLKPQMLVPALFLTVLTLGLKHYRTALGLAGGTLLIGALNYLIAGPALCQDWLRCLALSDRIYSDPAKGVAVHLATSLPRAILLSQPVTAQPLLKPALYALAGLLLLAGLAAVVKIARNTTLSDPAKIKYSFILGALALPSVVPHLFLYDLGALAPAALILFFEPDKNAPALQRRFKIILGLLWLCITIYCLILVTNTRLASPLFMVAIMFALYLRALTVIFMQHREIAD
ncbi:MAG: DUF2029 domain-containing protein [Cyanobacteria bacterium SZAS TMP-1]|nr:DUF2029 domain-containing protein [Cyanobacteria bacterium SZAS TMP-1]